MAEVDSDDIYREINEDNADECLREIQRLWNKRRGFKAYFTQCINNLAALIQAARGGADENLLDTSLGTREALQRQREKLEVSYDKLQRLHNRILSINSEDSEAENSKLYTKEEQATSNRYVQSIQAYGKLMVDLLPAPNAQVQNNNSHSIKPVQALKPSFTLSFDNSPTELHAWITQFRSYFETSRLDTLPASQQQAFLRQGLHPDVWIAIQQHIHLTLPIFDNPDDLDDDSCIRYIKDAFQIKYPLIMRRYRFFTYQRKGSQNFTNFYAKLKELAQAAQLEEMTQNDYLIFRVIVGINDPPSVDKLLAIPQEDFNIEEIHRIATAQEAARNYSQINKANSANVVNHAKFVNQNSGKKTVHKNKQQTGNNKLNILKQQGKCFRCGRKLHPTGEVCPHKNTKCHKCGVTGHISPVCAKGPQNDSNQKPRNQARQTNVANFAMATNGSRPTPRQQMSFQDNNHEFTHDVIPDSGSSRTIFAKNLLDKHDISFEPNYHNEELFNASNNPMTVNGTVELTATFYGKSKRLNGLVSEDLKDNILLSWHDAENLGSISITRQCDLIDPDERIKQIKNKYSKILQDSLSDKPMEGPPMKIHMSKEALAKGIFPKKVFTSAQIPIHLQPESDKVLKIAIKNKLIEEVPVNETSDWCSRGFFVSKPNGGARLVVDLSKLNEVIERPVHPFTAGTDLLKNLNADSKVFCKLDAVMGYFQIPLDEQSRKLTTFLLPSGRYRYLRAPMGCSASSDEWCKRSDAALAGITGVHKLIDDILIEGKDYKELFERIEIVLERCLKSNITISLKKMQVGETVNFAGYQVSEIGILPAKERTQAITEYPKPNSKTPLKGFLGLAQTLAHFLPDLAHATDPLRGLLKKNVAYQWLPDQQQAFQKTKEILTSNLVLKPFNPAYITELITDASRIGLGFVLLQQDPLTGNKHLIQCGSRSLNDAETRYAVCELEGLAISYAVTKCRHYLLGMQQFTVVTDHKPLKGVFTKDIPDIQNARLRKYRENLQEYNFQIEWREGKLNEIADALSRAPVFPPNESQGDDFTDVCHATSDLKQDTFDPILTPLIDTAKTDIDYQLIIKAISEVKCPKSLHTSHPGRQLSSVWSQLSVDKTGLVIVDGTKIYIPSPYRQTLLDGLHAAHCGTNKTIRRAKDLYYWRGMSSDIKNLVHNCDICRPFLPSQAQEPIIPGISATGPMTDLGSDLFQIGHNYYLVVVDRYSGFPFVEKLTSLSTATIIKILEGYFNLFGWPERIRSDNGPQYRSEFDDFCSKHSIIHENSSPHFPQSNGLAESCVKNMKFLMKKCNENQKEFSSRLLEFRNTPNVSGKSPAQMFFGRRLRGKLPHLPGANDLDISNAIVGATNRKALMKNMEFDSGNPLKQLQVNQRILLQDPISKKWENKGKVTGIRSNGRSYEIILDSGKKFIRNRSFLRPINEIHQEINTDDEATDDMESPTRPRRSARLAKNRKL